MTEFLMSWTRQKNGFGEALKLALKQRDQDGPFSVHSFEQYQALQQNNIKQFKPAADIKGRLLSRREKQLFSNRNQICPIDLVLGFVTSRRCNFFPASKSVGACYIFTFNKLQFNSSRKFVTFACKERYHAVKAERKLKCLEKQVDMPLHK